MKGFGESKSKRDEFRSRKKSKVESKKTLRLLRPVEGKGIQLGNIHEYIFTYNQ